MGSKMCSELVVRRVEPPQTDSVLLEKSEMVAPITNPSCALVGNLLLSLILAGYQPRTDTTGRSRCKKRSTQIVVKAQ